MRVAERSRGCGKDADGWHAEFSVNLVVSVSVFSVMERFAVKRNQCTV